MIMPAKTAEDSTDLLTLLQKLVIKYLEKGTKGSRFPVFHAYIDNPSDDLEADRIPQLKEEFVQIQSAFAFVMPPIQEKIIMRVPVHATGYSPTLGLSVEKDPKEAIPLFLNGAIEQCEIAILAKGGFGKFSVSPEEINRARKQLRQQIETIHIPSTGGMMEVKILAYDSNNNPEHHLLVDGLWVPYQVAGIIEIGLTSCGVPLPEKTVIGFMATMDYRTNKWEFNRFDAEFLQELAQKTSFFKEAYQRITGRGFNEPEISNVDFVLIEALQDKRYFRQNLDRICSRWIN